MLPDEQGFHEREAAIIRGIVQNVSVSDNFLSFWSSLVGCHEMVKYCSFLKVASETFTKFVSGFSHICVGAASPNWAFEVVNHMVFFQFLVIYSRIILHDQCPCFVILIINDQFHIGVICGWFYISSYDVLHSLLFLLVVRMHDSTIKELDINSGRGICRGCTLVIIPFVYGFLKALIDGKITKSIIHENLGDSI